MSEPEEEEGEGVEDLTGRERAALVRLSTRFLTLFSRPARQVDQRAWFRSIRPLLTVEAAEELSWVDPRRISHSSVNAGAELLPPAGESHLSRMVAVPTDGGLYVVHVMLAEDGPLVQGLTVPGGPR